MQAHENMDSESSIKSAPHYLRSESPRLDLTLTWSLKLWTVQMKNIDAKNSFIISYSRCDPGAQWIYAPI